MNKVIDSAFGEMQYRHGWVKKQKLLFWGTVLDIKIKATAYKGDEILQPQRDSYKQFMENIVVISARSLQLTADYLKKNYGISGHDRVKELVTPRTILFKRDGSYGILCDFELDEEHGLVICMAPKEEVGIQDIFL